MLLLKMNDGHSLGAMADLLCKEVIAISFKNRFVTRGVMSEIPFELQLFLWLLIDNLNEPKDYLQVFRLSASEGVQHIIHQQEEPEYHKEYDIKINAPVNAKVYVIDDDDHCTMLLAEEY